MKKAGVVTKKPSKQTPPNNIIPSSAASVTSTATAISAARTASDVSATAPSSATPATSATLTARAAIAVCATPTASAVPTTSAASNGPTYGPLSSPRTITISMIPDWNHMALCSPSRTATLTVVLGPSNTTPEEAEWKFTFNLYAERKQQPGASKKPEEEAIGKDSRAVLWYEGKAFPQYHHAVESDECRLSTSDKLKTVSVVLRADAQETDPNALVYVRGRYDKPRTEGAGYLKVVQGHSYYLNITFAAGSEIAQKVAEKAWRPTVYVNPLGPGHKLKVERVNTIKGLLIFANFKTSWPLGVEIIPDEREKRSAAEALAQDQQNKEAPKEKESNKDNAATIISAHNLGLAPLNMPSPPLLDTALFPAVPKKSNMLYFYQARNISLQNILLPDLDLKGWAPDFPLAQKIEKLYGAKQSRLAWAMLAVEAQARSVAEAKQHQAKEAMERVLSFLEAYSSLSAWQRIERFLENPDLATLPMFGAPNRSNAKASKMDELQARGQIIFKKMLYRVAWILACLMPKYTWDTEKSLRLLAADKCWAEEADAFMKDMATKIELMIQSNSERFEQYRQHISRDGIRWMHSVELLAQIEVSGFKFAPTMLEPDCTVCSCCGVKVVGWQPYYNPLSFHRHNIRHELFITGTFLEPTSKEVQMRISSSNEISSTSVVSQIGMFNSSGSSSASATQPQPPSSYPAKK